MSVPKGQQKVLRALGSDFAPTTTVEIAREVYPNHSAWENMGETGSRSWQGLVGKVSEMLQALATRRLVVRVGTDRWGRWGRKKKFFKDYLDWLGVLCDALVDEHELRDQALESIVWALTYTLSEYGRKTDVDVSQPTAFCVRSILDTTDWSQSASRREVALALRGVQKGVMILVLDQDAPSKEIEDLRDALDRTRVPFNSKAEQVFTDCLSSIRERLQRRKLRGISNQNSILHWTVPRSRL